jgi:hypothetical protein
MLKSIVLILTAINRHINVIQKLRTDWKLNINDIFINNILKDLLFFI